MIKYTLKDFESFEKDDLENIICPNGDYTQIKNFPERCSFGERCSFENIGCAKSGYPFMAFVGAGSSPGSKSYFFNLENGIYVRCGCFLGTISDFKERVKTRNADQLYLQFAELVEKKFIQLFHFKTIQ